MSFNDFENQKDSLNENSQHTLSIRKNSFFKDKFRNEMIQAENSTDTALNELSLNEDDAVCYEALGLRSVVQDMFSENTFNFVALHKVINTLVQKLGALWIFHEEHGSTLKQLMHEFEDEEDIKIKQPSPPKDMFFGKSKGAEKLGAFSTKLRYDDIPKYDNEYEDELMDPTLIPDDRFKVDRFEKDFFENGTPRVHTKVRETINPLETISTSANNIQSRIPDIKSQTETQIRDTQATVQLRDFGKTRIYQRKALKLKDILKSEVEQDLKNLVDKAIEEHSRVVSVTQIQRVPESKEEGLRNEMEGMKRQISDNAYREQTILKRFYEFDMGFPKIINDINKINMDMNFKASSEDVSKLYSIIPNLITRDDYDMLKEYLNEKTNLADHVNLKKQISEMKVQMKELVSYDDYNLDQAKLHKYNEILEINKLSLEEFNGREKYIFDLINKSKINLENNLKEIDDRLKNINSKISEINLTMTEKIDQRTFEQLEYRVDRLVSIDHLHALEERINPMLKDGFEKMHKIITAQEEFSEQVIRYDEMIMDKANKYDFILLRRLVDAMLPKLDYDDFLKEFKQDKEKWEQKMKYYDETIMGNSDTTLNNEIRIQEICNVMDELRKCYSEVMYKSDQSYLESLIQSKADKFDLIRLESEKASRLDLNSLAISVDYVHKQLEYNSMIGVKTLNAIVNNKFDEKSNKHKYTLYKYSISVHNWIKLWANGDALKIGVKVIPKEVENMYRDDDNQLSGLDGMRISFEKQNANKRMSSATNRYRKSYDFHKFDNLNKTITNGMAMSQVLPTLK